MSSVVHKIGFSVQKYGTKEKQESEFKDVFEDDVFENEVFEF